MHRPKMTRGTTLRRASSSSAGEFGSSASSSSPGNPRDDGSAASSSAFEGDEGPGTGSKRNDGLGSALERQIATTTMLRERFERDPFGAPEREALTAKCEYDNDVHAVRGAEEYATLMKHFGNVMKSSLTEFKMTTRRASCVEPGVLLIQWTAEWEGAKFGRKMSNMMLDSMHEGAVRRLVEGEFGEKLAPGYPSKDEEKARDKKCRVFGRTTYKVDQNGLVVSRQDRLDFRTDPEPGSQSMDEFYETVEEMEEEWERLAEETAANMFYNTLCPPDKNETSWFLDVLIELEWQSFNRQMGDTSGVLTRQEYVSVIYAVLASAILAPIFICVGLTMLLLSPEQATDPESLDAALSVAAPATGANGSPLWGAQVFLDLYKAKIGA